MRGSGDQVAPGPATTTLMSSLAITPRNFWLWFGGIWLSVGVPFLAIGVGFTIHQSLTAKRLEREGQPAEGMVLVKEVRRDDSGYTFKVSFRFSLTGDGPLVGSAEVDEEAWDALEERGPIPVTYLPGNPRSHRVPGQKMEVLLPVIFGILGGILTVLGGMVVLRTVSARRREAHLAEEGVVTRATVTDVHTARIRVHGTWQWRIRYRYEDGQGNAHQGVATVTPEEAEGWQPGQTGAVRFDPARPRRSVWLGKAGG